MRALLAAAALCVASLMALPAQAARFDWPDFSRDGYRPAWNQHWRLHRVAQARHHVRWSRHWQRHRAARQPDTIIHRVVHAIEQIVAHPAGCPRTLFCGCGVSVRVFGHSVRELWLAANWFRFPRAPAAPGNVAIFRGGGHVAYIEAVYGDGTALLYDPNSGGHLTRLHRRSLAGAVIVSPHRG